MQKGIVELNNFFCDYNLCYAYNYYFEHNYRIDYLHLQHFLP